MALPAALGAKLMAQATARGALRDGKHGIRFAYEDRDGRTALTVWSGKSKKPIFHHLVENRTAGAAVIAEMEEFARGKFEAEEEKKLRRTQDAQENRDKYTVGAILRKSGGYEQTNIDYYQITERSQSGATIVCRPIASRIVRSAGFMAEIVAPVPGEFIGPAIKKRVTAYGVQFAYGWTKIVDESDESHATHYA